MNNSEDINTIKHRKPGGGRKKKPSTVIEEALNNVRTEELPKLLQVLIDKAKGGDRDSAIYLLDRVLGRPSQSIDARMKASIQLTADDYTTAIREVVEAETQLLTGPSNDTDSI